MRSNLSRPRSAARVLLPPLLWLAPPLAASAQHTVHAFQGEAAGDWLGHALAVVGDLDGDGRPDLLIGAPRADSGGLNAGSAFLFGSAGWQLLLRLDGASGENLGWAVGGASDVDGDGAPDLVVGAPSAGGASGAPLRGLARVHSGASGALLHLFEGGTQFDRYGAAVAGAGDADGDGHGDLLVGAPTQDGNGVDSGMLHLLSGRTGATMLLFPGDQAGDQIGSAVAPLGDLDLDGHADFGAGAPYADHAGADAGLVRAWSGRTGAILFTRLGPTAGAELGRSLGSIGDIDLDGVPDLAAGAWRDPAGGAGAGSVRIWSGASGALLRVHLGAPGSGFGAAVAAGGDVDGDGVPDLLVGAPELGGGSAWILSGADGSTLAHIAGLQSGERLGAALAGGFDLEGDGRAEYALGAPLADAPATDAGRVTLHSQLDPLGAPFCFGDGSGTPCPCGNLGGQGEGCAHSGGSGALLRAAGSPSVVLDDLLLSGTQLRPSQPALLFAGLNALNGGLGQPFGDGLRCVGGGLVRLGVRTPDGAGDATWGPGLAALGDFEAGDRRRFQVWYRDPLGSPCGARFNLTHGHELRFAP